MYVGHAAPCLSWKCALFSGPVGTQLEWDEAGQPWPPHGHLRSPAAVRAKVASLAVALCSPASLCSCDLQVMPSTRLTKSASSRGVSPRSLAPLARLNLGGGRGVPPRNAPSLQMVVTGVCSSNRLPLVFSPTVPSVLSKVPRTVSETCLGQQGTLGWGDPSDHMPV